MRPSFFFRLISPFSLVFVLVASSSTIRAAENAPLPERTPSALSLSPAFITTFPIFLGVGALLTWNERLQAGVAYGITPQPYTNTIASAAKSFGNNESYDDLFKAAFDDNSSWRLHFQYAFNGRTGWLAGIAGSRINTSGSAPIDSVLQAVTGRDYTTLRNLLTAAGRSPDVALEADLWLGEVYGGYAWEIFPRFQLQTTIGAMKTLGSTVKLQTQLPNFEASAAGSSLLRSSEADLEEILRKYGMSPTLGLTVSYAF